MDYTARSSPPICLVTVCFQAYVLGILSSSATGPSDLAQFPDLKGHKVISLQNSVVHPTGFMKADRNDS